MTHHESPANAGQLERIKGEKMTTIKTILDRVQWDKSGGQGHCWVKAHEFDLPADIREEIAAEIIDGKKDECSNYVASNGQHYRW